MLPGAAVCFEEGQLALEREINFKDAGGRELAAVFGSREEAAVELGCCRHCAHGTNLHVQGGKAEASSMEWDRIAPAPVLGTLRGGGTSGNPDAADRTWISPAHPLCSQNPLALVMCLKINWDHGSDKHQNTTRQH